MKQKITPITLTYLSPAELAHSLHSMAILDIIMVPEEDNWLRLVQKYPSETLYHLENGGGDEMDILFEDNGIFIRGFDHENALNQFAAEEWNDTFFQETYADVPRNFLDACDEETRDTMTFCMWYDHCSACWRQNVTEGNDGGKQYLLGYICMDAAQWAKWAEEYYETAIDCTAVEKVYSGNSLTPEDIHRLNPARDAQAALREIKNSTPFSPQ